MPVGTTSCSSTMMISSTPISWRKAWPGWPRRPRWIPQSSVTAISRRLGKSQSVPWHLLSVALTNAAANEVDGRIRCHRRCSSSEPASAFLRYLIPINSCFIRRSALRDAQFPEAMRQGEDTYFWISLSRAGCRFLADERVYAYVRRHPGNITRSRRRYISEIQACYEQLLADGLLQSPDDAFLAHFKLMWFTGLTRQPGGSGTSAIFFLPPVYWRVSWCSGPATSVGERPSFRIEVCNGGRAFAHFVTPPKARSCRPDATPDPGGRANHGRSDGDRGEWYWSSTARKQIAGRG